MILIASFQDCVLYSLIFIGLRPMLLILSFQNLVTLSFKFIFRTFDRYLNETEKLIKRTFIFLVNFQISTLSNKHIDFPGLIILHQICDRFNVWRRCSATTSDYVDESFICIFFYLFCHEFWRFIVLSECIW